MKKYLISLLVLFLLLSTSFVGVSNQQEKVTTEKSCNTPVGSQMDFIWPMRGHDAQNTGQSEFVASQNEGYEKWKYFIEAALDNVLPVIDGNGTLYLTTSFYDGLYAIYPNGTTKWRNDLAGFFKYQPIIGLDGTIYVGTDVGFYALYPNNGTIRWKAPIEKDFGGLPIMSPEGILYVGTYDGFLYAIYPNGTIQWTYYLGYSYARPSLDTNGNIYLTAYACDYLYCLYPNGTLRWIFETVQDIWDAPLIGDDGTIYVLVGTDAIAITSDGIEKWRTPVDSEGYGPSLSPDGTIVYSSLAEDVFGLDPDDGHIRWHYKLNFNPDDKTRSAISSDGIIFFAYTDKSGDKAYLSALNPDGTLRWTTSITSDIYPYDGVFVGPIPSIAADGTVYVTTWFYRGGSNYTTFGYTHAFGQLDPDAPTAPTITGPPKGKVGEQYEYTFTSTSPTGKDVYYYIMWGDDTYENWIGPFQSGELVRVNHSWSKWGRYTIQARARDTDNLWSSLGTLEVRMPVSYNLPVMLFLERLLERFPNAFPMLRYLLGINQW
ncbi:MAG TPA: PQQ-binding-like beta-propeller repeat protein [Candidatus Thermoplasmatota archaeon]|nr:PQQ-binding-like beta-propeller repeat protein [Candidatus Thermoplasmatota archaeon]